MQATIHNGLAPGMLAVFIIVCVAVAGVAHTLWLRSSFSLPFKKPLDNNRLFLGKRIFGDNKTISGFMIMVPATGITFFLFGSIGIIWPDLQPPGLWELSPIGYGWLGLVAGFGFMAGELPNSFIKRQLGIAPGSQATRRLYRPIFLVVDRVDSILGLLFAISVVVTVPWETWVYVLLIGPVVHLLFSGWMFLLKVKSTPV